MVFVTLAIGFLGWRIARRAGLMAPAMLGPMIAVGLSNVLFDYAVMPTWIRVFAQGISAAFIAMSITRADIANVRKLAVPGAFLLALLTVNTIAMGFVINRLCGIDLVTALFSCIAGGVTDVTLISMDYGARLDTVALMQTSRLVMVLLIFPFWIKFACRNEPEEATDDNGSGGGAGLEQAGAARSQQLLGRITASRRSKAVFTIVLSLALAWAGKLSGLPSASMVFPLIAVAALNITRQACCMPRTVKDIARLLAGSLVGSEVSRATFSGLSTTLVPVLLLFASYWLVNIAYSFIMKRAGKLDLKSALFVSSPGGATDMSLIAADLNADLTKIAVLQVLRAVYAVAIMPTVAYLVSVLVS